MYVYVYIYIYTYVCDSCFTPGARRVVASRDSWVALLVSRYLSNAASFALGVFRRVKDHHSLLHYSPLLKTCVRQVVLDKWLPLRYAEVCRRSCRHKGYTSQQLQTRLFSKYRRAYSACVAKQIRVLAPYVVSETCSMQFRAHASFTGICRWSSALREPSFDDRELARSRTVPSLPKRVLKSLEASI